MYSFGLDNICHVIDKKESKMLGTKFSIESNVFESSATRTFKDLLFDNNFTDVTLACEDEQQINAHKVILSSASAFFERIFLKNSKRELLVYLKGISFRNLELMIKFIYLGVVELNEEELQPFIDAAKELEVKGLNTDVSKDFNIVLPEVDSTTKDPGNSLIKLSEEFTAARKLKTNIRRGNNDSMNIDNSSNHAITIDDEEVLTNVAISEDSFVEHKTVGVKTEMSSNVTPIMQFPMDQSQYTKSIKENKSFVHGKIKHQDSSSIECKECLAKFSSSGALTNHRKNKHEGISYSCEFCDYKNGQAGNLRRHLIRHHSNKDS